MGEDTSNRENSLPEDFELDDERSTRFHYPDWCEEKIRLAEEKYKKGEITEQEHFLLYLDILEEYSRSKELSDEEVDAIFGLDNMDSETLK